MQGRFNQRAVSLSAFLFVSLFLIFGAGIAWGGSASDLPGDALATAAGAKVEVTGELTVLVIDDFKRKSSKVIYKLKDQQSGKVYKLHFRGEPPGKLRTGSVVTVRGKAKGKDIYLMADGGTGQIQEVVSSAPAVSGEQKTIVLVGSALSCAAGSGRRPDAACCRKRRP